MADKGPFLTSCIIFYLSIGAAIFQILEEPNWEAARDRFIQQKENLLRTNRVTKETLEEILKIASEAAGQGVAITGNNRHNTWDWGNSVIFAATIVTTIGYGNVAPKTEGGRVFCILYGLCGIPLCLVWISTLGSFFGDRAKRLSGILIKKGVSVKKVQLTCTAIFLLWGLLVHLVIPPIVFMFMEEWSYLEGIYFSFITLTTVGFGDYVAGVNPDIEYPKLYRVLAEVWMYMGLAWLSLFFSWNVHMVVEAHKVFKKKRMHRNRNRILYEQEPDSEEEKQRQEVKRTVVDIFDFLSEKDEDYSTVIKEIGIKEKRKKIPENIIINRSKSCSDILGNSIRTLEHSPRHKRHISLSDVFANAMVDQKEQEEENLTRQGNIKEPTSEVWEKINHKEDNKDGSSESVNDGITFTAPDRNVAEEENVQHPEGGETRFTISKVAEIDLELELDEKG
ncbi:PREDICTED: potassium channel subfamily K member 5-like [Cyprinodon variegatus]|uniref:Potassium channel, subfamily K, member 5b n=1 Tax=Cyprinodon variegatus TaxID=28743 RepID=A0A3Q2DWS4_CYPVA|nr:PREDICTED: potassium channel subfamily K member 5-like [Cyprinodon variegatus]